MRRGGLGRARIQAEQTMRQNLARAGAVLNAETARRMKQQLETFKGNLEQFAVKHQKEIQRDPAFRARFHVMCASIGVDPLTSRKGAWSSLLGVGDYYYELGVRIIEICLRTREMNGGLLELSELLTALRRFRMTYTEAVTGDDVERAVAKLSVLGSGFKIVSAGNRRLVRSVPKELSTDHTTALGLAANGHLTASQLQSSLGWSHVRIQQTLDFLLQSEIAWIDLQAKEPTYWIAGLLKGSADT